MEARGQEQSEKRRQLENALQAARFEAVRAHRQYDAVDPDNRLVAGELEHRWNERLVAARALEQQLEELVARPTSSLEPGARERLLSLGQDLSRAWDTPGATVETKKKILRLVIAEIIVDVVGDTIALIVHWEGGDHTRLEMKKNKGGQTRWVTDADVVDLVRALARHMPDQTIAAVLNRSGKSTGRGNSWTRSRVCSLRNQKDIAAYQDGERSERGEVTLFEAAESLAVSPSTIRRMIAAGVLEGLQVCKGAPWIIRYDDLALEDVRREAQVRRTRRPSSHDPLQKMLHL
jgi:excisionase family DNA binding protein